MPKLTLVRGFPGSGKSTIAKRMASSNLNMIHLEADMYHIDDKGMYLWKEENSSLAHEWCLKTTQIFLRSGYDVVVSNTFTRRVEMAPYLEIPNVEVRVIRAVGEYANTHDVPEETLKMMKEKWED